MREVHVRIGKGGRIETDFRGFLDDDCLDEADRLAKALSGLGLSLNLRDRVMKSVEARMAEAGMDAGAEAEARARARARQGGSA